MSFITQIQASLQGCIIETPHSADIRDICGITQCVQTGVPKVGATTETANTIIIEYGAATVISTGAAGYIARINTLPVSVLNAVSVNTTQVRVTINGTMAAGDKINLSFDSTKSDLTVGGEPANSYYQYPVGNTL